MCEEKQKQWFNVKFVVKFQKTTSMCYKLLKEAYGKNSLSRVPLFEWYKGFYEGRESTENDQHPSRPVCLNSANSDQNE